MCTFGIKALIADLTADEEKQWCEWCRGKPITDKGLADLLGQFRIKSRAVGPNHDAKGYLKKYFGDAWARYLPPRKEETREEEDEGAPVPPLPSTRPSDCNGKGNGKKGPSEQTSPDGEKIDDLSNESSELDGWTGRRLLTGAQPAGKREE